MVNKSIKTAVEDATKYMTPTELAQHWRWHTESVRRMLRERRLTSIIISRRRLIPLSEILRVEQAGLVARVA